MNTFCALPLTRSAVYFGSIYTLSHALLSGGGGQTLLGPLPSPNTPQGFLGTSSQFAGVSLFLATQWLLHVFSAVIGTVLLLQVLLSGNLFCSCALNYGLINHVAQLTMQSCRFVPLLRRCAVEKQCSCSVRASTRFRQDDLMWGNRCAYVPWTLNYMQDSAIFCSEVADWKLHLGWSSQDFWLRWVDLERKGNNISLREILLWGCIYFLMRKCVYLSTLLGGNQELHAVE